MGVADIRIVITVVAVGRRNAPLFERVSRGDGEYAPIFFRASGAPCGVPWGINPRRRFGFLGIKGLL